MPAPSCDILDLETSNSLGGEGHESTPPTTVSSLASTDPARSDCQPSSSQVRYPDNNVIPMPTLYNDASEPSTSDGRPRGQPRMGTIEVLLYNMASMLAGVAVGYDVRLSNVSPIHPKLYPKR